MNYRKLAILLFLSSCVPFLQASDKKKKISKSTAKELHKAAEKGDSEHVISLIKKGADVNLQDKYGQTPMHIAARDNKMTIVDILLNNTLVDLDLRDDNGFTPLYLAVLHGNLDIVKRLIYAGARTDLAGNNGETPLHVAVMMNDLSLVELLIKKGKADVNAKTNEGLTPFDYARNPAMKNLLMKYQTK